METLPSLMSLLSLRISDITRYTLPTPYAITIPGAISGLHAGQ